MPPRFSRSRITSVISLVPPGIVKSSEGSGSVSDCGCPFFGGRGISRVVGIGEHRAAVAEHAQHAVERRAMLVGLHLDSQSLAWRHRQDELVLVARRIDSAVEHDGSDHSRRRSRRIGGFAELGIASIPQAVAAIPHQGPACRPAPGARPSIALEIRGANQVGAERRAHGGRGDLDVAAAFRPAVPGRPSRRRGRPAGKSPRPSARPR